MRKSHNLVTLFCYKVLNDQTKVNSVYNALINYASLFVIFVTTTIRLHLLRNLCCRCEFITTLRWVGNWALGGALVRVKVL